jgi:hypothetical protein
VKSGRLLAVGCRITAASGTTPTLDLRVEYSLDAGSTWAIGDPTTGDAFTQRSSAYYGIKIFQPKGDLYRVSWTLAGTTPSFTFEVQAGWLR